MEDLEGAIMMLVVEVEDKEVGAAQVPWRKTFPGFLATIILFSLKFLKPLFSVMARLMEDTMQIQKQSARPSIFVQMMEMEG